MPRSENLLSQKSEGSCMKEAGGMDALIQYIFELEDLKTAMKAEMEATQAAIKSYMTEAQG